MDNKKIFTHEEVNDHFNKISPDQHFNGGFTDNMGRKPKEGHTNKGLPHGNYEKKIIDISKINPDSHENPTKPLGGWAGEENEAHAQKWSKKNDKLPTIIVKPHPTKPGHYITMDGVHRARVAHLRGEKNIEAFVHKPELEKSENMNKSENLNNKFAFIACDGDGIGSKVARASLADDVEGLSSISSKIESGNEAIKDFIVKAGGQIISFGGDEANGRIPLDSVIDLEALRTDYAYITGATLSIGIGESLSQASKSLDIAKLNGKNQILQYTPEVEQQWQQVSEKINSSNPAEEEAKKIGEAHMKNSEQKPQKEPLNDKKQDNGPKDEVSEDQSESSDCPFCSDSDDKLIDNDCPFCQDEESEEINSNDCPFCEESHPEDQHIHDDSCPHCQELANNESQKGDPRTDALDQTTSEGSQEPVPSEENQEVVEQKPKEYGAEEHQTPEEVMEDFDEAHGEDPSQEDQSKYDEIDNTGIAEAGDGQEKNISRPDDFNGEIPEGSEDPNNTDGSEEPDYSGVMQEDLDNNQDDIQKQKVGDMVRQALQSFKASKQFLEQAQSQAPEFYQANILMLRGMIEMAKLLGFGGSVQPSDQPELGQEESAMIPEQPDSSNPFPQHPDNGGQDESQSDDSSGSDSSAPFPQHPDHGGAPGKKIKAQ